MRVDVIVRPVAVLALANQVGQLSNLVERRGRLVQKQTVLKLEPAARQHFVANLVEACGHKQWLVLVASDKCNASAN